MGRRLYQIARIEIGALMEMENHHDSLSRLDIPQPFEVFCVDDKRALNIGDGPMPGNPFNIGAHETNRIHYNAQLHFLHFSLAIFSASSAISFTNRIGR